MGAGIIRERSREVALELNFYFKGTIVCHLIWDPSKTQHCIDTVIVF